jgi:hypothetical protein
MTDYNTTTLAAAIMGDEAIETNRKSATRTLRKFLRDELGEGKSVVGKGGRYTLTYNKRELTAMTKRFRAWEVAQEEAKAARAEALAALKAPKASVNALAEDAVRGGSSVNAIILPTDDTGTEDINDDDIEGPTDDEIAALLEDDDTDEI